ncbi:MAG: PDZ domain-containing protein, partial [Odoribacter sp.]|nr:PDZ domain-containing protein [Odoribacter sp.]
CVNGSGDRSACGIPDEKGVVVLEVAKNSQLHAAGIHAGDVIYKLNKHTLTSVDDLFNLVKKYKGFKEMDIDYFRNQQLFVTQLKDLP